MKRKLLKKDISKKILERRNAQKIIVENTRLSRDTINSIANCRRSVMITTAVEFTVGYNKLFEAGAVMADLFDEIDI